VTDDWHLDVTAHAIRDIERLNPATRQRILTGLDRLAQDPSGGDTRKLQGTPDQWRLRVGDWRIRFRRDDANRTIRVLRVLPRDRAYRD